MIQRTVSIKLAPTPEQASALTELRAAFVDACNRISRVAAERKVWNRVALHHLVYYPVRADSPLGSQMVCNAVKAAADAYKVRKPNRKEDVTPSVFRPTASVHFDKRTYSFKGESLSLYTLSGREIVAMKLGAFQRDLLSRGAPKEAELVRKGKRWYFNLVLDLPDPEPSGGTDAFGVDLGENNLAATSTGKLFGGGALREKRDRHLALRRRLQANGSQSARQRLRAISGREQRHMRHVNHEVSKALVAEAVRSGAGTVVLEDLKHIRRRIRAGKRMRSRLHRWAWRQLQVFVEYKAEGAGLLVEYVNPAYTSQDCSACGARGTRHRHRFSCSNCGLRAHSDGNAARNLAGIVLLFSDTRGAVTRPTVAA